MRLAKRLGYTAARGWQVVVLPAVGGVDAVVLLPDGDLPAAESALDADALATLLAAPTPALLHLFVPKFRVRARARLNQALSELGVRTMFTEQADFDGISPRRRCGWIPCSTRRFSPIDEQGLEGAAATVMAARAMAMHRDLSQPIEVRVDRPFLFLVRHKQSGAIYFLARVVQP